LREVTLLSAEELQGIVNAAFPAWALPHVESVDDDSLVLVLPVDEKNTRPGGTLSGPTMMALADNAAWLVILAHIGPQLLAVTTSLHIDFLRKPEVADLVARARILKLGRRLAVVDVEVSSSGSKDLVAKAQVTYSIPPRTDS
jgi:uncharacterized protein (TIGR00369 family)